MVVRALLGTPQSMALGCVPDHAFFPGVQFSQAACLPALQAESAQDFQGRVAAVGGVLASTL